MYEHVSIKAILLLTMKKVTVQRMKSNTFYQSIQSIIINPSCADFRFTKKRIEISNFEYKHAGYAVGSSNIKAIKVYSFLNKCISCFPHNETTPENKASRDFSKAYY